MTSHPSPSVTITLAPTFGTSAADVGRIRNGRVSWLNEMDMSPEPIFTLKTPLEIEGIAKGELRNGGNRLRTPPPSSVRTVRSDEITVSGVPPDLSVRRALFTDRMEMEMSVDALSRSILLTDVDERTFVDVLRRHPDTDHDDLEAVKRALLVPTFYDNLDTASAARAQQLLTENIRRHELNHIHSLINPETALWRELELYWRSVLVGANPRTWNDPGFLRRFARLYATPSHFIVELLALLTEDYTIADSSVQQVVEAGVANQRETAGLLMEFVEEHDVDRDALRQTLRSSVGEQCCDLWLAYVFDKMRSGHSLSEIDAGKFREQYLSRLDSHDEIVTDSETRAMLVDFVRERCFGPVFEVVRLDVVDEQFVLERAWYSLNPDVSDAGSRLAVRRALFRRQFLSLYGSESGLIDVRSAQGNAVEQVIRGSSLDDVALSSVAYPSLEQLSESLTTAHEATATELLGNQATTDDLHHWLNDPEYGVSQITQETRV